MPKVFIPSMPLRFDSATQEHVPALDLNPAAEYGELTVMTSGKPDDLQGAIDAVNARTTEIGPDDMILAVGDLMLVAAAVAQMCRVHGVAKVLRWDKKRKDYDLTEVKL